MEAEEFVNGTMVYNNHHTNLGYKWYSHSDVIKALQEFSDLQNAELRKEVEGLNDKLEAERKNGDRMDSLQQIVILKRA